MFLGWTYGLYILNKQHHHQHHHRHHHPQRYRPLVVVVWWHECASLLGKWKFNFPCVGVFVYRCVSTTVIPAKLQRCVQVCVCVCVCVEYLSGYIATLTDSLTNHLTEWLPVMIVATNQKHVFLFLLAVVAIIVVVILTFMNCMRFSLTLLLLAFKCWSFYLNREKKIVFFFFLLIKLVFSSVRRLRYVLMTDFPGYVDTFQCEERERERVRDSERLLLLLCANMFNLVWDYEYTRIHECVFEIFCYSWYAIDMTVMCVCMCNSTALLLYSTLLFTTFYVSK